MESFEDFKLSNPLRNAIAELGFERPTPVQQAAFSVVCSGKDVVGISQTGTGKTFAYMLPILHQLKYSKQTNPRVLVLVPTRELVVQLVENIESYAQFINVRVLGVFGESNIRSQKDALVLGTDIVVATPGRLFDLAVSRSVKLTGISKLVIDEVDVMLDLGFLPQLESIFDLLPERRQNIMFSATMTEEVDDLIHEFFISPNKISIAVSGTPLDNISQQCYAVKNFNTKVNLLTYLLADRNEYDKVLVFVDSKKIADRLFDALQREFATDLCIVHSNKTQNFRLRSIQEFEEGNRRILIATDVIARGLDLDKISHVINFDTPAFPENYMHRIGRTGRAEEQGKSLLFYTEKEAESKLGIEELMKYEIPELEFPEEVELNHVLIPEERTRQKEANYNRNLRKKQIAEPQEKLDKNKKVNLGGSYKRKLKEKYKKPKTRGDKNQNKKKR